MLSPETPAQPSPIRRIFFNPQGLRPAWGIALFLALPAALLTLSRLLAHYYPQLTGQAVGPTQLRPGLILFSEALSFTALAVIAFLISLLEKRSFLTYGFALPHAVRHLATGLAWGFLMLSALITALYFAHAIAFHGLALHGLPTLAYAFYWAPAFFLVALFEEFFFRGYLQTTLARALSTILPPASAFWLSAAFLSGLVFAWAHTGNSGETPWGIAAVALAGLTFAFSLYRTGSLWWAIGFHTAWDWAQSFFYGTPDSGNLALGHLLSTTPTGPALLSGGTAGPEGSILVIPTLLLTCLVIHRTLPSRTGAPPPSRS